MTWANTIILSWFGEGNLDFFFISLSQDTYEIPKEKKNISHQANLLQNIAWQVQFAII